MKFGSSTTSPLMISSFRPRFRPVSEYSVQSAPGLSVDDHARQPGTPVGAIVQLAIKL